MNKSLAIIFPQISIFIIYIEKTLIRAKEMNVTFRKKETFYKMKKSQVIFFPNFNFQSSMKNLIQTKESNVAFRKKGAFTEWTHPVPSFSNQFQSSSLKTFNQKMDKCGVLKVGVCKPKELSPSQLFWQFNFQSLQKLYYSKKDKCGILKEGDFYTEGTFPEPSFTPISIFKLYFFILIQTKEKNLAFQKTRLFTEWTNPLLPFPPI